MLFPEGLLGVSWRVLEEAGRQAGGAHTCPRLIYSRSFPMNEHLLWTELISLQAQWGNKDTRAYIGPQESSKSKGRDLSQKLEAHLICTTQPPLCSSPAFLLTCVCACVCVCVCVCVEGGGGGEGCDLGAWEVDLETACQ